MCIKLFIREKKINSETIWTLYTLYWLNYFFSIMNWCIDWRQERIAENKKNVGKLICKRNSCFSLQFVTWQSRYQELLQKLFLRKHINIPSYDRIYSWKKYFFFFLFCYSLSRGEKKTSIKINILYLSPFVSLQHTGVLHSKRLPSWFAYSANKIARVVHLNSASFKFELKFHSHRLLKECKHRKIVTVFVYISTTISLEIIM